MFFHISVVCDKDGYATPGTCVGPIYDFEWCIQLACKRFLERYPQYAEEKEAVCKALREYGHCVPEHPVNDGWGLYIISPVNVNQKPIDNT